MDEDSLTAARGEIIEDFIDLETMVNTVISAHYFKEISIPFYYEVLYDENFSFGFKLKILAKIVPQDKQNRRHIENLRSLNHIRNYFAHRGAQFLPPGELGENGMVGFVPDPKNLDKVIDYDKLYKDFRNKQTIEFQYLDKLIKKIAESKFQ